MTRVILLFLVFVAVCFLADAAGYRAGIGFARRHKTQNESLGAFLLRYLGLRRP